MSLVRARFKVSWSSFAPASPLIGPACATDLPYPESDTRPEATRVDLRVSSVDERCAEFTILTLAHSEEGASLLTPSAWHWHLIMEINGDLCVRPYTPIRSSATTLTFAVKKVPDGRASRVLGNLERGDELTAFGPVKGPYTHRFGVHRALNLVLGGSGVTPGVSILEREVRARKPANICMVYAARDEHELMALDRIHAAVEALQKRGSNCQVHICLSRPSGTALGSLLAAYPLLKPHGERASAAFIHEHLYGTNAGPLNLICGPDGFVDAFATALEGLGHHPELIVEFPNIDKEDLGPVPDVSEAAFRDGGDRGHVWPDGRPFSNTEISRWEALPAVTLDDVRAHQYWMVVDGIVLDVESFVGRHPGGSIIMEGCRADDASAMFNDSYHKLTARRTLWQLAVGKIAPDPPGMMEEIRRSLGVRRSRGKFQLQDPTSDDDDESGFQRGGFRSRGSVTFANVLRQGGDGDDGDDDDDDDDDGDDGAGMDQEDGSDFNLTTVADLLGKEKIEEISRDFHDRIWSRSEGSRVATLFKTRAEKDHVTFMLTLFLMQHLGQDRNWGGFEMPLDNMKHVHSQFQITIRDRDEWMEIMEEVMDSKFPPTIQGSAKLAKLARGAVMAYFGKLADSFVNRK